jgi:PKD domain-containing protein
MKKLILFLLFLTLYYSCGGDSDDITYPPTPTPIENIAPTPNGSVNTYNARIGDTLTFDSGTSNDSDGDNSKQTSRWDFDGDKTFDTSFANYKTNVTHVFDSAGNYNSILEVKDEDGKTAKKTLDKITIVDNVAPTAQGVANTTNGLLTDVYNFDWSASDDPDGNNSDLEARIIPKEGATPSAWTPYGTAISHTFATGGNYNPALEVKDKDDGVGTTTLDNLGVLDVNNNPINIATTGPGFAEVGKNLVFNINAEDNDGRPLSYSVNFGEGWNETNETINKTYNTVGAHSLETMATTDYNISNTDEDEVNVGPEKPSTNFLFGPNGKKYRVAWVDGKIITVDDFQGMVPDYEGKTEEAPFYNNDSITHSQTFGKLYSRDDVNKGLKDVVFHDDAGKVYQAHVTTMGEYDEVIDAYDGEATAGSELKYDGFDSNGNNSSRMAMMLGRTYYSPVGFGLIGESGTYITGTDLGNEKNTRVTFYKGNGNVGVGESGNEHRRYVKFTIEQN